MEILSQYYSTNSKEVHTKKRVQRITQPTQYMSLLEDNSKALPMKPHLSSVPLLDNCKNLPSPVKLDGPKLIPERTAALTLN